MRSPARTPLASASPPGMTDATAPSSVKARPSRAPSKTTKTFGSSGSSAGGSPADRSSSEAISAFSKQPARETPAMAAADRSSLTLMRR